LEYDDVMNKQREVIYAQRKEVLKGEYLWSTVEDMLEEVVDNMLAEYVDEKLRPDEWNLKGLGDIVYKRFSLRTDFNQLDDNNVIDNEYVREKINSGVKTLLHDKEEKFGKPLMEQVMRIIMLQSIDAHWKDHLLAMDHLKEGIGLRGYGQKDPKREYQREGYDMFMDMVYRIKEDTLEKLCWVQVQMEDDIKQVQKPQSENYIMSRGDGGFRDSLPTAYPSALRIAARRICH